MESDSNNRSKDMLAKTISQRVRAARLQLGWTKDQLAEASGLNSQVIKSLEKGERSAYIHSVVQVANALHLSVDYLTGRIEQDDISSIHQMYAQLPPEAQEIIVIIIQTYLNNKYQIHFTADNGRFILQK